MQAGHTANRLRFRAIQHPNAARGGLAWPGRTGRARKRGVFQDMHRFPETFRMKRGRIKRGLYYLPTVAPCSYIVLFAPCDRRGLGDLCAVFAGSARRAGRRKRGQPAEDRPALGLNRRHSLSPNTAHGHVLSLGSDDRMVFLAGSAIWAMPTTTRSSSRIFRSTASSPVHGVRTPWSLGSIPSWATSPGGGPRNRYPHQVQPAGMAVLPVRLRAAPSVGPVSSGSG